MTDMIFFYKIIYTKKVIKNINNEFLDKPIKNDILDDITNQLSTIKMECT